MANRPKSGVAPMPPSTKAIHRPPSGRSLTANRPSSDGSLPIGRVTKGADKSTSKLERPPSQGRSNKFLDQEAEYMKINAELEERTAQLAFEAEEVRRGQDAMLMTASYDHLRLSAQDDVFNDSPFSRKKYVNTPNKPHKKVYDDKAIEINTDGDAMLQAVVSGELGEEASIRYLRAKLKILQQDLDETMEALRVKEIKEADLEARLKSVSTEGAKVDGLYQKLLSQSDKLKREHDIVVGKFEVEHTLSLSLKKELEDLKRAQKKGEGSQAALEVRLNRALEENEKMKTQLQSSSRTATDADVQVRSRLEQSEADSKRLLKQKTELLNAFKKQMKLIDILKRQKLHIEAAKMLSFSEEDFVAALDWGK